MVKPRSSPNYEIDLLNVTTKQVRHLTANTPKEKSNIGPIWSKDGNSIVFTERHANHTNSNIWLAEVAGKKRTLLTPHAGEHNYIASDLSGDGKWVLLTSNADNGYDNVGLLETATKNIEWLTKDTWEIISGRFSPDGKLATWTANVDGNQEIFTYDLAAKRATALPIAQGCEFPRRIRVPVFTRWLAAALVPRWTDRAKGRVDIRPRKRQIAAAYQQLRWRRSRRRHGRAISCPLSVER